MTITEDETRYLLTRREQIVNMSEGNPGAMTVLLNILVHYQNNADGVNIITLLDTLEIRGSKIWMLFKDVCDQDLVKMIGVLKAHQLGFISKECLITGMMNYGEGIDVEYCLSRVRETLPNFQ